MDNIKLAPFLEIPALKVQQPLGDFYVMTMSAEQLLSVSFSEPMAYQDEFGKVKGSQRAKDEKRLKEIAKYIDSVEMAFPNSIILAANYTPTGVVSKDESERWKVIEDKECSIYKIIIPRQTKLAAIIDGQHRLNAFEFVVNRERVDLLQLVCSVYFDLPNSYQAFLFATINSNQKKVDRSLALEQFGFNVDDEPEKAWTPEKFAVFISRKLNIDEGKSPFYKHIKVAPLNAENLFEDGVQSNWVVSTATIVDGITSLISTNVKRDRVEMQQKHFFSGRNREMLTGFKSDTSPLRSYFIELKDQVIYDTIINYFSAVKDLLWNTASEKSYIIRTVGIQASFDILKLILKSKTSIEPDKIGFNSYILKIQNIDFSDTFFQASGIGRSRIRNIIGLSMGLIAKDKIKKSDIPFYEKILAGKNTNTEKEKWIWEEEAENAVINTLDKIEWNYGSKNITLYPNYDYDKPLIIDSYDKLYSKLIEIAESAFSDYLPNDNEFAEEQREKFDVDDLVESHLTDYDENLRILGWV
ncbi:DNA phosphorothioation-associated DGQHR protein 1 [Chitinophaga eiseniae]|uniref:DNA phosphorothioation-associated DGQHR protein 1 n=1 Tax=Chitinophaga eiseniae TaxID=634771 RepID=A0A1T4RD95_9BACT|nr:DNA phosphorothioation-associated DGQHR protein 1 [Chitinophaga eiseniae]SKA13776.1 DNA phosphorothioation-associated DGQHR protein 1 [Chitinophaga eiseniae]